MYHTIVIGTGCAGYNAADWLYDLGVTNIAVITEGINMGTSRNTGSDKQTYYKMSVAGEGGDSVYHMAKTLFDGGAVHGDTALIEAAGSVKSFMKLVNLGLPFPTNEYGAYIGYKTDHDPGALQRATSCGPLTSKLMTEALEKSVRAKGIQIFDQCHALKILVEDNEVKGVVTSVPGTVYSTLYCGNIILATGGPAGIYADSVFPVSQTGGTGLALAAGAVMCNLNQWQYGLASTDFRWNVSGTYQQVLPRYISVDAEGNEYEFVHEHYTTPDRGLNRVFLKGYQWPFDTLKVPGSSEIDLLVAAEMKEKGRTVYMDFRRNPSGLDFAKLSEEAYGYLEKSEALFGTPIERLAKMNPKAIQLYKNNGIDLYKEPLKVAVCAQHCNGGVAVDANWQSSVKGLYAAGEAAGSFGIYRPGGSALNATQVGAMRAAEHIAKQKEPQQSAVYSFGSPQIKYSGTPTAEANMKARAEQMSKYAAYNRDINKMKELHSQFSRDMETFYADNTIRDESGIPLLYKCRDLLATQIAVLSAMIFSAEEAGTHSGALVVKQNGAENSESAISESTISKSAVLKSTAHVVTTAAGKSYFEPVRPLPPCNDWFEQMWNEQNKE
jgi:succinate dehydrogenase/fumarate reductase flavoprotein subunit